MGDRGNIVLRYGTSDKDKAPQDIYLYTHWGGSDIPTIVQAALARKVRWNDDSYLGRIMFVALIGKQQGEETGYGISPYPPDNEHDYLMLDLDALHVLRVDPDSGTVKASWTFTEYIALNLDTAKGLKDF